MYSIRVFPSLTNHGRNVSSTFFQSANYATRSPNLEAKLGLPERPKKPASPYLMFVKQTYPELSKMTPKIPFKEAVQKVSEQWKNVDIETKTKMMNEYHEKLQKFPQAIKQYYDSLTDAQRVQLEAAKQEKNELKKKRQATQELKKTGKPTRPVSSFGIFVAEQYLKDVSLKHNFGPTAMKVMSKKWRSMTDDEKLPYKTKYQDAYKIYETKIVEWEEEMVRQGKESLIRSRSRPTSTPNTKKVLPLGTSKNIDTSLKSKSK